MKNRYIHFWASDFSHNTGEGKLAKMFINNLSKDEKFRQIKSGAINKFLNHKYIDPFFGIFYCWIFFFKKEKVAFINYLPLWNPIIFIFLPPKTIMGPITGGALFNKKSLLNYFVRRYFFPILYKISEFFINIRSSSLIFSTDLLKRYLSKKTIRKSKFNFVFTNFGKKKLVKKKVDFLIYYRKHRNKENFFPINFIQQLVKFGFEVNIIGDRLNIPLVKNHGTINNKRVSRLQAITKYTIASGENPYSFFILECLSNNMKVIINKKNKNKIKFNERNFIEINFNDVKDFKKLKLKKIIRL